MQHPVEAHLPALAGESVSQPQPALMSGRATTMVPAGQAKGPYADRRPPMDSGGGGEVA